MKKKIILILLAVLAVMLLFSLFGKKGDPSSAKLVGYDSRSFEKTMKVYFKDMMNEEVKSFSYEWKQGWPGEYAPDSDFLSSHEKPVTFVTSVQLAYAGGTETNRMVYYLIHDKKHNTLSVQGGFFDEDGEQYPFSLSEARSELEAIFDEYN
ncbi:MAG: hypothetical protein IJC88_06455 [Oscillospiraceae bacterium]|nr:hypothetical protein [Oscillospiraceae bacterium]